MKNQGSKSEQNSKQKNSHKVRMIVQPLAKHVGHESENYSQDVSHFTSSFSLLFARIIMS